MKKQQRKETQCAHKYEDIKQKETMAQGTSQFRIHVTISRP